MDGLLFTLSAGRGPATRFSRHHDSAAANRYSADHREQSSERSGVGPSAPAPVHSSQWNPYDGHRSAATAAAAADAAATIPASASDAVPSDGSGARRRPTPGADNLFHRPPADRRRQELEHRDSAAALSAAAATDNHSSLLGDATGSAGNDHCSAESSATAAASAQAAADWRPIKLTSQYLIIFITSGGSCDGCCCHQQPSREPQHRPSIDAPGGSGGGSDRRVVGRDPVAPSDARTPNAGPFAEADVG